MKDFSETLLKLRNDPELVVRHVIGAEPQAWQVVALRAIAADD